MNKSLVLLIVSAVAANAASVTQTETFTIDESYGAIGSGSTEVVDGDYLQASVSAFDTGLGTLESFTLTWTLVGSFTGTLAQPGGGASIGYSGPFLINGLGFGDSVNGSGSGGGGNGSGGPGGMVVSLPFTTPGNPTSFSRVFFVADAGADYDQAILDAVLGGTPLDLEWDTPLTVLGNFDDLTVSGSGSVTMEYNYVPEPSGLVLGLAALGSILLRRRR